MGHFCVGERRLNWTCHLHKSWTSVVVIGAASALFFFGQHGHASSASAEASVTISESAAIGVVDDQATESPTVEPTETTTSTSTAIVTTPVSTTSSVGLFSDPAPVATTEDAQDAETSATSGAAGESAAPTGAARPFPGLNAVPIGIGNGSAIAVAGSPNQTYSIVLPERTAFSNGSEIVNIDEFQHNAGQTPSMDSSGSDVFAVGARVSTETSQSTSVSQDAFTTGPAILGVDLLFD